MNAPANQLLGCGPVLAISASAVSPLKRWVIGVTGLVIVVALAITVAEYAKDPVLSSVESIDILGTVDYEDRSALRSAIAAHTNKGFYVLNIDEIRQTVEQMPWIAHARVSRVWPDRIEVHVEEHEPAARWNDDSFISKRLALFSPPQL